MGSRIIAVICVAFAVSMAQPTHAAPIAEWITQWNVKFDPTNSGTAALNGNAEAVRNFGAASRADGDITDTGFVFEPLPGTPALARARSSVSSVNFSVPRDTASTTVDFQRTMRLSGSPDGWNVMTSGLLRGTLSVDNLTLHPLASVGAIFSIETGNPLPDAHVDIDFSAPPDLFISTLKNNTTMLPDGAYLVKGFLTTSTQIDQGIIPTGAASSDFAGTGAVHPAELGVFVNEDDFSFNASVVATPIAEPSSLVLFGAALVCLSALRHRRNARKT